MQDTQAVEAAIAEALPETDPLMSMNAIDTRQPPDRRGLQWALDTFEGAYNVGKQSAKGAIELLRDTWDTSSGASLLYGLVAVLVISNIYTFLMVGRREEVGRRKAESRKSLERQEWIGDTVRVLLQELRSEPSQAPGVALGSFTTPGSTIPDTPADVSADLSQLHQALDDIEKRISHIRGQLAEIQGNV